MYRPDPRIAFLNNWHLEAIAEYLDESFPPPHHVALYPKAARDRATAPEQPKRAVVAATTARSA